MSYKILTIPPFDKQLKRLVKKYPSLKKEFTEFVSSIRTNPEQGEGIGKGCYKTRLAISSKGKGKSGGARIILSIAVSDKLVYLIAIYDKSEKASLSTKELEELLEYIE